MDKLPEEALLDWYADQHPRTVDIVGDFAGRELFAIQGEALMRYCLSEAKVDFDGGFQLLHAIHAVEKFLSSLKKNDCSFDLVFFQDLEDVCVPDGVRGSNHASKYLLARRILIQHLDRSDIDIKVLELSSFESDECNDYLASNAIHFMLCDEGRGDSREQTIRLRHLIWKILDSGRNVAVINSIVLKSSKGSLLDLRLDRPTRNTKQPSDFSLAVLEEISQPQFLSSKLSAREKIVVAFCRVYLEQLSTRDNPPEDDIVRVEALILQVATLKICRIRDRCFSFTNRNLSPDDNKFLHMFCTTSQDLAENRVGLTGRTKWDLYDLIDGRLFFNILEALRNGRGVSPSILEQGKSLREKVFHDRTADVSLQVETEHVDPAAVAVFRDLHHWHTYKPVATRKTRVEVLPWAEKIRQKRRQRQMADVVSYAASLTNSIGKVFDRETIVVNSRPLRKSAYAPPKASSGNSSRNEGGSRMVRVRGKELALLASQQLREDKAQTKRNDVLRLWAEKCAELENGKDLVMCYLKAQEFQDHAVVRPEVSLYLCNVLVKIWAHTRKDVDEGSPQGLYLVSMMWNRLQAISRSRNCTPEIANAAKEMVAALSMTQLKIVENEPRRKLPFSIRPGLLRNVSKLVRDHRILQLEHGGPYMDRQFDSQPDTRVSFEPDAWQRDVLDSIDANESLLVVAPTSAGKTFISFYAMKKILEESDDGVLVYVAPTKALVNQIAAEIEARFSKQYKNQQGKSIWAIHTRDYRINHPTRCQILVTVPHMLQVMLLAPTNANRPGAWSLRVKRIIFDEVHCIGQAEDGIIWEQLLLLAPCPIIALSATVGNPEELRDWLAKSEARKGCSMKMIMHHVRYSDLRKFIYEPPERFVFRELSRPSRLPMPGLDEGNCVSSSFKNRAALYDINLEARDCLTLWKHMNKTFTRELLEGLDSPEALPEVIEKSHVSGWEKALKGKLKTAMESPDSTFQALKESIEASTTASDSPRADHMANLFALAFELHAQDALPALVFNYDRLECERAVKGMLSTLEEAESAFKESDTTWQKKLNEFGQWQKQKRSSLENQSFNRPKHHGERIPSKLETVRLQASAETSPWEGFNPEWPLSQFSFAGTKAMQQKEFDDLMASLDADRVPLWLIAALRRGLGVHHAGMNRRYRQIVEMLFRRGYLRLVVATGTLALGINMPCKTVVFSGDSVFLSPQNYRQASGRAGRRGFDLLGNVVFNGISRDRVHEIMSSRLPALKGQFPISTTLILRLFILLHGTNNCRFAVDAVQALLSQTRLYLGGPDAEMSVKHHLRFSIEYLRRQNLLSATGTPIHFAGLVGHLYFTENAVFAFHSLLRGGYFHELCKNIDTARQRVLREMMLVLGHLFNRIPIHQKSKLLNVVERSSSEMSLQRLPAAAEELLVRHNQQTLSIFKNYVHSYIIQHLTDMEDRMLPLTKISVGPEKGIACGLESEPPPVIRSPFAALSGFTDNFDSIQDLCSTVRDGVFLEESAIPHINIWPCDTNVEFNAYLYDFFRHGSLTVLVRENHIRRGEVWFHLNDFSLTLKTIVTSLRGVISSGEEFEMEDAEDEARDTGDAEVIPWTTEALGKKKAKSRVPESWEDESDTCVSESEPGSHSGVVGSSGSEEESGLDKGGGLIKVLRAFTLLEQEFLDKFYKVGA
ncbi:hypothetical protein N0V84_011507 [Fusarium piperis]|uniref:Helicase n=1 Tax=Fusarium piperis TaxID=1435070 RepID=A0A9W8TAE5_9HYPO|nr:hypothetical protein N0V84_011507 [Fusarium piperis]